MLTIEKYTNKYKNKWNSFVKRSYNGTIFSHRNFINYHIDRSFVDHSLIIKEGREIIALLPAAIIDQKKSKGRIDIYINCNYLSIFKEN